MRVVVFLPCAGKSFPPRFAESYQKAKTYLQFNFDCEIVEYYPKWFPPSEFRNDCVGRMKDGFKHFKADTSIWLDIDHDLPYDVLVKLLSHKLPVVSGIYYLSKHPFYPIVYKRWKKAKEFWLYESMVDYPEELFEADMVGMGCVKIDREVFMDLEVPYFQYRGHSIEEQNESQEVLKYKIKHGIRDNTEEVSFWEQVTKKYKIMVDPSIQLLHQGETWTGKEEFLYNKMMGVYK